MSGKCSHFQFLLTFGMKTNSQTTQNVPFTMTYRAETLCTTQTKNKHHVNSHQILLKHSPVPFDALAPVCDAEAPHMHYRKPMGDKRMTEF